MWNENSLVRVITIKNCCWKLQLFKKIIIIIIILLIWEFFTQALADGFSPESGWQQVPSSF